MSQAHRRGSFLPPTERQINVLRAYVEYGTHDDAARALGIGHRTVKSHLAALRARLGVHNEAQAVYVLWLPFRDHVAACERVSHESCLRAVALSDGPWSMP